LLGTLVAENKLGRRQLGLGASLRRTGCLSIPLLAQTVGGVDEQAVAENADEEKCQGRRQHLEHRVQPQPGHGRIEPTGEGGAPARQAVGAREVRGYDQLEQRIKGSHEKNIRDGGHRFRAAKDARALRDVVTFHWEMLRADSEKIVATGLASWSGGESGERKLIVRGQAHLLEDLKALDDLERVRLLFDDLETRREVIDLLGRAEQAEGVRIFIGSENKLFSLSGSSTIVAPYHDATGRIVGVLGVIGPTRLNYARIVPMVDYTAKVVSKLLGG